MSPSSLQLDYNRKLFTYQATGVRAYWVVHPDKQIVIVYDFEHDTMAEYGFIDKVKVGIYEDYETDFAQLNIQ